MNTHLNRIAALIGLPVSLWRVRRGNPVAVLGLMRAASTGLMLAALAPILPMLANAPDRHTLIRDANRPRLAAMVHPV
jgi:hypothetical protein